MIDRVQYSISLRDVWNEFLDAMIRFWSNRFKNDKDPLVNHLELELEREQFKNKTLTEYIMSLSSKGNEEIKEKEINTANLKPLGRRHWRDLAREYEAESRLKRQQMDDKLSSKSTDDSISALEKEVGIS